MPQSKYCSRCRTIHKNECPKKPKADHVGPRFRGSPSSRGYDWDWTKARRIKVKNDPLCEDCLEETNGQPPYVPVEEVHHIKSVKTHPKLRLEQSNLRSLCKSHHVKRTARGE